MSFSNRVMYLKCFLNNFGIKTPFLDILDILSFCNIDYFNNIDDVYTIKNSTTVLVGNGISPSFGISKMINYDYIDFNFKKTDVYSCFQDFKMPFNCRKKFDKRFKKEAFIYYKLLLDSGKRVKMYGEGMTTPTFEMVLDKVEAFEASWNKITENNWSLVIEEYREEDLFRIFLKNNKILKVYGIVPGYVVGDGRSSLAELIDTLDNDRKKNILYQSYSMRKELINLNLDIVPRENEVIELNGSRKFEDGAMYIDLTNTVEGKFVPLLENLNEIFPSKPYLEVLCGSNDIRAGLDSGSFYINSINQGEDLRHLFSCISNINDFKLIINSIFNDDYKCAMPVFYKPEVYDNSHLKYTSQLYTLTAMAYTLGLKTEKLDRHLIRIKDPKKQESMVFIWGMSLYTSEIARKVTSDKYYTKKILEKHGINTPKGMIFDIGEEGLGWSSALDVLPNKRLVLKPLNLQGGKGVSTDITTREEFKKAWDICKNLGSKTVVIEEQLTGDDYRIVVIKDSVIGVSQRVSAFVIGDGVSTIKELIDAKNSIREKNIFFKDTLIKISNQMISFLAKRNLDLSDVPKMGTNIRLSEVANAGAGGDIVDRTDDIHPDWIQVAVDIRKIMVNSIHLGLDIMMEDIAKSPLEQEWAIIEVNTNPDFGVQLFPGYGKPRNVGKLFLEHFFSKIEGEKKAYRLLIEGKVQNVGFRNWFKYVCDYRFLVGYVKNLEDKNQIEVLVIGAESILDDVVKLAYKGPSRSRVDLIILTDIDILECKDKYSSFTIY